MGKRGAYSGNRLAPGTKRFVELLRDGPRPFEETLIEAAKSVPPGLAIRRFTKGVRTQNRSAFYELPPQEYQILSGSRWIVLASIRGLFVGGKLVIFDNGMTEMVMLTPEGRQVLLGEYPPKPTDWDPRWTRIPAYSTTDKRYTMASGGPDAEPDRGTD